MQLISTTVSGSLSEPALDIDNTGNLFPGIVILDDISIHSTSSNYSVILEGVDAEISGLDLSGDGGGMYWGARGSLPSRISNSVIWDSPSDCIELVSHTELLANGVSLICDEIPEIDQSSVNFTGSSLATRSGSTSTFSLSNNSHLRWVSSGDILTPQSSEDDVIADVMWMVDVHTTNQNLLNIPLAKVNITFDEFESEVLATQHTRECSITGHSSARDGRQSRVGRPPIQHTSDAITTEYTMIRSQCRLMVICGSTAGWN